MTHGTCPISSDNRGSPIPYRLLQASHHYLFEVGEAHALGPHQIGFLFDPTESHLTLTHNCLAWDGERFLNRPSSEVMRCLQASSSIRDTDLQSDCACISLPRYFWCPSLFAGSLLPFKPFNWLPNAHFTGCVRPFHAKVLSAMISPALSQRRSSILTTGINMNSRFCSFWVNRSLGKCCPGSQNSWEVTSVGGCFIPYCLNSLSSHRSLCKLRAPISFPLLLTRYCLIGTWYTSLPVDMGISYSYFLFP